MKILIVEDTPAKAQSLEQYVNECCTDSKFEVRHAEDAHFAFSTIEEWHPDLVLLDVRIPFSHSSDATDEASRWLVRELRRKLDKGLKPLVVGVTQFKEAKDAVKEDFAKELWKVVVVDQSNGEWKRWIKYSIEYVTCNLIIGGPVEALGPVDAAVVTALRAPELNALIDVFKGGERITISDTNENWVKCELIDGRGTKRTVVLACAEDMGMSAMSALVTRVCMTVRPRNLILCGIMGGNRKEVAMTDLVLIEETWDCRAGKLVNEGLRADVKCRPCDGSLKNLAIGTFDKSFFLRAMKEWKGGDIPYMPKFKHGAVACSPAVLAADSSFDELESQKRKVLGVEMEAFGCYYAASNLGEKAPRCISLKSVCDLGDSNKSDEVQQFAAYVSALSAYEILSRNGMWT